MDYEDINQQNEIKYPFWILQLSANVHKAWQLSFVQCKLAMLIIWAVLRAL